MTQIAVPIIWCIVQVSLLCLMGGLLYLVVRTIEPRLGRTSVAVLLTLVTALSLASTSPWPSWQLFAFAADTPQQAQRASDSGVPNSAVLEDGIAMGAASPALAQPQDNVTSTAFWQALWDELNRSPSTQQVAPAEATTPAWHWSAVALAFLAIAVAMGVLRLAAACFALRSWKRGSSPIDAPRLKWIVTGLAREMRVPLAVELREAKMIQTAATMGWRQPVILLPPAWRDWPEEELRAVLAHELAHIRACDWPTWLVAQVAVTLHFYHPLVHWLAGRLRLEQELAADAAAASVTGSQDKYLGALASQLLRADKARLTWAAQTFLPTRSTIVRRIEMLKSKSPRVLSGGLPGRTHCTMAAAILAVGLVVAGFRGPGGGSSTELRAQEPVPPKPRLSQAPPAAPQANADEGRLDLIRLPAGWTRLDAYTALVENNAVVMFIGRPRDIFASDEMAPLVAQFNQLLAENSLEFAGLKVEELDAVVLSPYESAGRPSMRTVLSFAEPIEASSIGPQWARFQEVEKVGNHSLRTLSGGPNGVAAMSWGVSQIVFDSSYEALKSLATRSNLEHLEQPQWLQDTQRPREIPGAWLAVNMDFIRRQVAQMPADQQQQPPLAMVRPLIEKPRTFSVTAEFSPSLEISGVAVCDNEADAAHVVSTAQAAVTLARNMIAEQIRSAPEGTPQAMIVGTITMADKFLQSAKFGAVGSEVHMTLASGSLGQQLIQMGFVLPAIQNARQAAMRTQSTNNLKQLGLAMYLYHDQHEHFPSGAVTGPDGKTTHSWRVALLPYLEQSALYDEYRLTEPWDSEHNKKLIERMPAIFRSPTEPAGTTTSAYHVLIGEQTMFAPQGDAAKLSEILDGTANTLMIVEARRDTPWTKPEDLSYSQDQPLPPLGGFFKGFFLAAFADGSVQVIDENVDQTVLRRLIEKADGQPVQR